MKSNFISNLSEKIFSVSKVISENRYVKVLRDAFSSTIPLTIVASILLLINNLIVGGEIGVLKDMPGHEIISEICVQGYNGTMGILTLAITVLVGANLAKSFGSDGILEGIIALVAYVTWIPNTVSVWLSTGQTANADAVLTSTFNGSQGMFMGLIAAIISVRLLIALQKSDKLKIHMPESVPSAIAKSFDSLFPAGIVVALFSIVAVAVQHCLGMSVLDVLNAVVRAPLMGSFQSYFGIVFYCFLTIFLFAFGIHGPFVLSAVSSPIFLAAIEENMAAAKAGQVVPNIVTGPFVESFVYITMISLVIAIFIGSKRADYKMIGKIGMVPAIFNISEPLVFGLPIAFNPILAIPFVICPVVSSSIAYIAFSLGFVSKTCAVVPWVTPALISGYFTTGGDIRGSILQLIIIVIGILIYLPFVIMANKQKEAE